MFKPNFLVIGAPRSGTTTLYHWLRAHPQIFMPDVKEPSYFAYVGRKYLYRDGERLPLPPYSTDWDAYLTLFADAKGATAIGEASVAYLSSPEAPRRIRDTLPHVRLIAVLRNPVERAFSHYLLGVRDGWAPASFREALRKEEEEEEQRRSDGLTPLMHWYKRAGEYATQLSRYLEVFPPEQIKVYLYEDLFENPQHVVRDVYEFLGVDPDFLPDLTRRDNPSGIPRFARFWRWVVNLPPEGLLRRTYRRVLPWTVRSRIHRMFVSKQRPPMPLDVRDELIQYFRPEIIRLQKLLRRDLSHWLS